jgi:hypothetical protein
VLSSWPPIEARYLSFGEKASARTWTLCNVQRLWSFFVSKSQMMISALHGLVWMEIIT